MSASLLRSLKNRYDDHIDNKSSHFAAKIAGYCHKYHAQKGTQFVFSDLDAYKPGEWNPYSEIKGRAIRKGDEIVKLHADNKVDVIIYAVEKSLDSYKFNLLHNKQLFITQLKTNNMGARTIEEGSMDEKSGMNFSEYVAILSGNTDLPDKARPEKKVAAPESERRSFNQNKTSSDYQLQDTLRQVDGHRETAERIKGNIKYSYNNDHIANAPF